MSKIIKVIDNETIEISDYRSPNRCFKTNEYGNYGDFEVYCVLKEKINPFSLYAENQRLNNIINKIFNFMQEKYDKSDLLGFTISFQELEDLKELKEGKEK